MCLDNKSKNIHACDFNCYLFIILNKLKMKCNLRGKKYDFIYSGGTRLWSLGLLAFLLSFWIELLFGFFREAFKIELSETFSEKLFCWAIELLLVRAFRDAFKIKPLIWTCSEVFRGTFIKAFREAFNIEFSDELL